MVHENLQLALSQNYTAVKAQHPTESRRKWCLRVLYQSWSNLSSSLPGGTDNNLSFMMGSDQDPFDIFLEGDEPGLIIRTDFTNDEAWGKFCETVQTSQEDLLSELKGQDAGASPDQEITMEDEALSNSDAEGTDSSDETPNILKVLNPSNTQDRAVLTNISNIGALRLFNDVDIRQAPSPPEKMRKISHPLIDQEGWQEIYSGKTIWIYDNRSTFDGCIRLVSQAGDFYGTATGDSWRARAAHVCELQFGISYQGLRVDFGGLDKWDFEERARNLRESAV